MTVVAVLADPPRPGLVFPDLADDEDVSPEDAATLYEAAFVDVCRAVTTSGGDLLVNYRPDGSLPESFRRGDGTVSEALRNALDLEIEDGVRFEPQVGETFAGRAGNTVTHLLQEEDATSAAVVTPGATFLTRSVVDGAAMKFRQRQVVLGPAPDGRVYYAGFTDPIDFQEAYTPPAVSTLIDRALDAGFDADFLPMHPFVETPADLARAVVLLRARQRAGRTVPSAFADVVADLDIVVENRADGPMLA